jgi:hypothetical protein
MSNNTNRRTAKRFTISATVEIFHKGYTIELPTRDLSVTGAGIVACGVDHVSPGDQVLVNLSPELEFHARIVRASNDVLHLEFDPSVRDDVEAYLREAHGLVD